MLSGSLAFALFVHQDLLSKYKVWAMEREATIVISCVHYVLTGACVNHCLTSPVMSVGSGHGHHVRFYLEVYFKL